MKEACCMNYVFMTDSDSDLPYSLKAKYDIPVVYMPYAIDGKEYFDDLGQTMDQHTYFDKMRAGATPVTSALNQADYMEYFEPILKEQDLLFVAFSSQLSCTIQAVYAAREELLAKYPQRKFIVVDTLSISGPMTMLLLKAHELYREGKSMEEVAQWLDDRTADIGFLSYQEDMPYDWIPLAEDPMLALLPKDHPLARAKAYPLANCAVDRFIMPAKGCDDDLMALFHRTGIVPNVQFTTLESLSAMSMVEQGLGMSVMNKLITERRVCDIVMLPVDPPASITLGIALHSKADLSPAVRMFLKYAVRMLTRQKKT